MARITSQSKVRVTHQPQAKLRFHLEVRVNGASKAGLQKGGVRGFLCTGVLDQEATVSHRGDPWHPIACGSAAKEQIQGGAERAPGVGRGYTQTIDSSPLIPSG